MSDTATESGLDQPTLAGEGSNGFHEEEIEPASPQPDTMFDGLRESYARSTVDRTKTILIAPGRYSGNLAVKLRPTEKIWKDYRKRAERVDRKGGGEQAMLDFAASTLVQCCETILFRPADNTELIPLAECYSAWKGGEPVRFDERLAFAIGIDLIGGESATQICRLVFKSEGALDDAFVTADAWLKEAIPSDEDEEDEGSPPS